MALVQQAGSLCAGRGGKLSFPWHARLAASPKPSLGMPGLLKLASKPRVGSDGCRPGPNLHGPRINQRFIQVLTPLSIALPACGAAAGISQDIDVRTDLQAEEARITPVRASLPSQPATGLPCRWRQVMPRCYASIQNPTHRA